MLQQFELLDAENPECVSLNWYTARSRHALTCAFRSRVLFWKSSDVAEFVGLIFGAFWIRLALWEHFGKTVLGYLVWHLGMAFCWSIFIWQFSFLGIVFGPFSRCMSWLMDRTGGISFDTLVVWLLPLELEVSFRQSRFYRQTCFVVGSNFEVFLGM